MLKFDQQQPWPSGIKLFRHPFQVFRTRLVRIWIRSYLRSFIFPSIRFAKLRGNAVRMCELVGYLGRKGEIFTRIAPYH